MDSEEVIARLETFEGRVPHMYRCTGGDVTIGIGHALLAIGDVAALPWMIGNRPAAANEAQADFQKVAAAPMGLVAGKYAGLTQCRLSDSDILQLARTDLESFVTRLSAELRNWNSYPNPVQAALFDMAFNLGIGGLKKFVKLLEAVDSGDWETAAQECHRRGVSEQRNDAVAALFWRAKSTQARAIG
ncbi:MAG: hypothetical protein C5B51_13960 [Terriglobia bacterium]|nr:MAG: hypothetical protein C5B51_13960 [Terriglobia bacterium]